MKHIVLTGYMGVGKTTLGKQLAQHYHCSFYDIDEEIIQGEKSSIQELIEYSEAYFRCLEQAYVNQALNRTQPSIIALGGGAFCQSKTYELIKEANVLTIYINMSDNTCLNYLEQIKASRPLLTAMEGEEWKIQALNLYKQRRPLYERAQMHINREGLDLKDVIQSIEKQYGKIY